jgi:hypothetical protein
MLHLVLVIFSIKADKKFKIFMSVLKNADTMVLYQCQPFF